MIGLLSGQTMTVLAATAAYVGAGYLWYSDMLFKKFSDKTKPKKMVIDNELYLLFAHTLCSLLSVIALLIVINIFSAIQTYKYASQGLTQLFGWILDGASTNNTIGASLQAALFVWLGFKFPSSFCAALWREDSWKAVSIRVGGSLAMLLAAAVTIAIVS